MADDDVDPVADLYSHLAATAELAVASPAAEYLGEAQSIAADLDASDPDDVVIVNRVEQIGELLDRIEATDNSEADAHVEAARDAAATAIDEYGG